MVVGRRLYMPFISNFVAPCLKSSTTFQRRGFLLSQLTASFTHTNCVLSNHVSINRAALAFLHMLLYYFSCMTAGASLRAYHLTWLLVTMSLSFFDSTNTLAQTSAYKFEASCLHTSGIKLVRFPLFTSH